MSNLTSAQLAAIEKYRINLESITDIEVLRRQVLANYRQNLIMHNTYLNILANHWEIDVEVPDTSND